MPCIQQGASILDGDLLLSGFACVAEEGEERDVGKQRYRGGGRDRASANVTTQEVHTHVRNTYIDIHNTYIHSHVKIFRHTHIRTRI